MVEKETCLILGETTLDKLEEMLLKYRSKKFLVVEPGGNNGDRLIYIGMEKKLKELGINYMVLKYKENPRSPLLSTLYYKLWKKILDITKLISKSNNSLDRTIGKIDKKIYARTLRLIKIQADPTHVILIHGGGNINDLWGHGIRLLSNVIHHNPNSAIIVGPQTYWFQETRFPELFLNTRQEIYLFCRERYSYSLLNSMKLPENVHINLSHDTTFYLSKKHFRSRPGAYDLICLRTDYESALFQKRKELSVLRKIGMRDLRKSKRKVFIGDIYLLPKFRDFLHLIEGSRAVHTDRLHVAILATILHKDTTLYSNSYYKNKGVYEYSLSKYPNAKFLDISKLFKEIEAIGLQ